MSKIKYIAFLVLVSLGVRSQESITLPKAVAIALDKNYQIKIDEKSILIAENNNTWAQAGKMPTIDLTANLTNNLAADNNPASFIQGEFYNASLNANAAINWVVYAGGRVKIAKDQLDLAVDQQRLNQLSGIHDLMRSVYQNYYDVLLQQERLIVLESTLNLSKIRLDYEEARRSFGSSNSFNLIQFENAVITDSINLVNQIQQVEISKRNLYNTLNIIGYANYNFPERLSITDEEIDLASLKKVFSEENYTLKSLEMVAGLNRLNTKLSKTAMLPTVSVNASFAAAQNAFTIFADNPQTGEPFGLLWSNRFTGNVGATANWRLYDFGVRQTDISNAKIQEDIDQMTIIETQATLGNQLEILASNYENQRQVLSLADDQIKIAERNLTITEERFKGGLLSSIDFRNVQNQYLSAAFSKVNAIYSLILTKSEIDYLVGKFSN